MFRLILLLFSLSLLQAKETICLNMIVKDESAVIARCLASVKPFIDYWVIVDTGSKDATKKIIKSCLKGIPGELYDRPWKNFGENRSEAFLLAKGKADYILFMDADDILEPDPGFEMTDLSEDLYHMWRGSGSFSYLTPQLARADLPWKWVGVTHEYLGCDQAYTSKTLEKIRYVNGPGGKRSHGIGKFLENIRLLEDGLKKEPDNERYAFYLAESYRDAGEKGKALEWFQNRVSRGGWGEEVFWSLLQIGHLLRDLGLSSNIVKMSYLNAHTYRPHRAEAIYYLSEECNKEQSYAEAYAYLKSWSKTAKPAVKDVLFNEEWIEDYGLLFQLSVCAYYVGEYQEALDVCNALLVNERLPENLRRQTIENRKYPIAKLEEMRKEPKA